MSDNSLTAAISLGVQSAKGSVATAFKTALATDSSGNIKFDTREPKLEHPSGSARATKVKIAQQRVGYTTPFDAKFLLRPNFIGEVLRGLGFGVATTGTSPAYTHTFTIANSGAGKFLSAIILDTDDGGGSFERLFLDCKCTKLTVDAGIDEITCDMAGIGLSESDSAGTETKVAETAVEISPTAGSATLVANGDTIDAPIRGSQLDIEQTLDDADRVLFSNVRNSLPQKEVGVSGMIKGVDFDYGTYHWYRNVVRGNTSATEPTLTPATGSVTYNYTSLTNIPTGVVPYKFQITVPSVYWEMQDVKRSGNNLVRADVKWTMIDNSSPPVTIVLVNGQSSYA